MFCLFLGDSGYQVKPYLLTPLLNPNTAPQNLYNKSHIRTRNVVERLIGVWKRRFPVLAYGTRCKIDTTLAIIVATSVLHNIAIHMNEDMPLPPDEINQDELDYLILQGDVPVPQVGPNLGGNAPDITYREHLINNYFSNL